MLPRAFGGSSLPARTVWKARILHRAFAHNIYDDSPVTAASYKGTPKEVSEAVFHQFSQGGGVPSILPGASFRDACQAMAQVHPELQALTDPALEGRAFELLDADGQGSICVDEWVDGIHSILNPKTKKYANLSSRLKQGRINLTSGDYSHVKRVAIVGGGVAGLQTARALSRRGKDVVVFEKSSNVGGVWRANYDAFGLQVPNELYEFPDFPPPKGEEWDKFPTGEQVQKYIEAYCEHNELSKMIRFNQGVSRIEVGDDEGKGWNIYSGGRDEEPKKEHFDYVIVATGMYGWPPHIPKVRGSENFEGEIYHSANFFDASVCKDKHVVVVGGGKSAVDNAVSAARHGKSSTLLFRSAHWPVPRYLCNLIGFQWGTYSRFGHFMLPVHFDVSPVAWYFHSLLTPVKWVWWRVVELMFRVQFRLTGDMVPKVRIEHDVFSGGQILNYNFRDMLRSGKVAAKKGSLGTIYPKHVELLDGTEMPCDMVVFGTGFAKSYDLFDRLVQSKLNIQADGMYMHRNIIPPGVADLAFVGSEVSTFNNILTQGLQAEWLARLLDGKLEAPERRKMLARIEIMQSWKRAWMPPTSARAAILQLHMMKYHDRLVMDMGEKHLRKGMNVFAEAFAPYSAADYREIFARDPNEGPTGAAHA